MQLCTSVICNSANITSVDTTQYTKSVILYGPPGTGKTREAKIRAAKLVGINLENVNDAINNVDKQIETTDGRIKLIQFHPSYSYFDFVEGIEAGEGGFELKEKVFKAFANSAKKALNEISNESQMVTEESDEDALTKQQTENRNYVLIIDEINRANMASVFGELLYALEYRGKEISTSGGSLVIPDNLYIIGTMNTADVSIAGIDYAVRRRFDFTKMNTCRPDSEQQVDENSNFYKVGEKWFINSLYNKVREDVEKSVARGINVEDIMPGISYFLVNNKNSNGNDKFDREHLYYKIDYEIVPLLLEYAKNGLFSKRYKISSEKSLHEMLKNMEYSEQLKACLKKEDEEGQGENN